MPRPKGSSNGLRGQGSPKHSSVSWVQGASRTSVALRKLASPAMTLVWARISQKPTLRAFRFERSTLSKTKPNPRHPSVRRETLLQKAGLKSSSGSSARRAWRSTLRRFHEAKELAGCEEGCKSRHPIKGPARKRVEVTGLSRELTALAGVLCTWPPHPHFDHVRVRLHHWVYTHSEGTSCTHASLSVFFKSCRNVSEGPCWPHRNDRRSLTRRDSLCERAHKKNFTINQPQGKSCRPADKKRTRKAATNSGGQQETECVAGVDSRMLSSLCGRALQQDSFLHSSEEWGWTKVSLWDALRGRQGYCAETGGSGCRKANEDQKCARRRLLNGINPAASLRETRKPALLPLSLPYLHRNRSEST